MFLSNTELKAAMDRGELTVNPRPEVFGSGYDNSSVDLHLGGIETAKIWDPDLLRTHHEEQGKHHGAFPKSPCVALGDFEYKQFAGKYLIAVPDEPAEGEKPIPVYRKGQEVYIRPGGFMLWSTREEVGTPEVGAQYIAFVNAKSTKARTGLLVHFSAPTIEAAWTGKITLEIANLGPFVFMLKPNDAIAALTVAKITSPPDHNLRKRKSQTDRQTDPSAH